MSPCSLLSAGREGRHADEEEAFRHLAGVNRNQGVNNKEKMAEGRMAGKKSGKGKGQGRRRQMSKEEARRRREEKRAGRQKELEAKRAAKKGPMKLGAKKMID